MTLAPDIGVLLYPDERKFGMSKALLLRLRSAAPPPTTSPKHLSAETRDWWDRAASTHKLKDHQGASSRSGRKPGT